MNPNLPATTDNEETRALDLLRTGRRFVLVGHVRPDGDCFGAQAALSRVLASLGKEIWILNSHVPGPEFEHLTQSCLYRRYTGGDLPAHDVAVLLDTCELERCGALGEALRAAPSRKLVVDHHVVRGPAWWDAAFMDTGASATGVLVYRLAQKLGVVLDVVAARGVFTSIVTDTGWFRHPNADAETFAVASALVALGVDPAGVYATLHQRRGSDHPLALARALDRLRYYADGRLAVVGLAHGVGSGGGPADGVEVLDILRSVGRVEVVLLLRATAEGTCRVSMRSKTDFDVEALARQFGGGGHVRAAGAEVPGALDDVELRLVSAALEALANDPGERVRRA